MMSGSSSSLFRSTTSNGSNNNDSGNDKSSSRNQTNGRSSLLRRPPPPPPRTKTPDDIVNETVAATLGTDDHNTVMVVKYGLMIVGALAVLKFVSQILWYTLLIALPFGYTYLVQTCPPETSFQVKEQLKPLLLLKTKESNQQQQEGKRSSLLSSSQQGSSSYLSQFLSSAKANVSAEYYSSYCTPEFTTLLCGAGRLVTVSTTAMDDVMTYYYWIGVRNQWHYVYSCSSKSKSFSKTSKTDESYGRTSSTLTSSAVSAAASAAVAALSGSQKSSTTS